MLMIKTVITSIMVWTAGTILTILLYFAMLIAIAINPFDKKRKLAHAQCFWWAEAVFKINPYWGVSTSGLGNIDKTKTYIIVANHQSLADIVIIYMTKMQFKWVAKKSLFKVPFVGWCLSLARHVKLERGDFGSIKQIYREAATWLRSGMSVLFFPEGTRRDAGGVGDFQNGAFKLAIKEKVPVLPIAIEGTGEAIPRGTWLFRTKIPVKIKVLPAIDTSGFKPGEFAALRDAARAALESA